MLVEILGFYGSQLSCYLDGASIYSVPYLD
jgi:hypothetical protein